MRLRPAHAKWLLANLIVFFTATALIADCSGRPGNLQPSDLLDGPITLATGTHAPSSTPEPTETATSTPTPLPTPTPTTPPPSFFEPAGCQAPPSDYSRLFVRRWEFNNRTYAMLQHAATLYTGILDITNLSITQGSYTARDPASFGTHQGGGAVDLSVRIPGGWSVVYTDIEPLIRALRVAGFAAWYRDTGELYPGSSVHIHAIAIGDEELSSAAQGQLDGDFGYFRGYTGVPTDDGIPLPDRHPGPILCGWMKDLGYQDLRPEAAQRVQPIGDWVSRLKAVAAGYIAPSSDQAYEVAHGLGYLGGVNESPETMCGPLMAAILRDAQLLPTGPGPMGDLKSYFLAQGMRLQGVPWTYYDEADYDLYIFDIAAVIFDFAAWPLLPGDIVYTYAGSGEYEHMLVVTEVDAQGRAYTVTNLQQDDLSFHIQKLLLYDPNDPSLGAFVNEFMRDSRTYGRTGLGGFDVLRRRGITLPPGSEYEYIVEPGDTLLTIAAMFNSTVYAIAEANAMQIDGTLEVGQSLIVPVNIATPISLPALNTP